MISEKDTFSDFTLVYEYFPELLAKEVMIDKVTHRKQWVKFMNAFTELCLWIHSPYAKHKNGTGIVLFNSWWNKHFGNSHKWTYFKVVDELEPYIYSNHEYDYRKNIAKEWIVTENFRQRTIQLILDFRFEANPCWGYVIRNLLDENNKQYQYDKVSKGYIELGESVRHIDSKSYSNISSALIIKGYIDALSSGQQLQYSVSNTGRLHHPLQNIKKEDRMILFQDWYSYDFKACAPSMLAQEYYRLVPNGHLPAIEMFIENRSEIRSQIAKQINADEKTVKQVLTGLFFGQTVPSEKQALWDIERHDKTKITVDQFTFAIINTFGPDVSAKLLSNELFLSIVHECQHKVFKHLAYALREKAQTLDDGQLSLTNLAGGIKIMKRWNSKQAVAHWYFGAERQAIDVVSDELSKNDIQFLLIHDGFICNKPIDKQSLQRKIKKKTGFNLEVILQQEKEYTS